MVFLTICKLNQCHTIYILFFIYQIEDFFVITLLKKYLLLSFNQQYILHSSIVLNNRIFLDEDRKGLTISF